MVSAKLVYAVALLSLSVAAQNTGGGGARGGVRGAGAGAVQAGGRGGGRAGGQTGAGGAFNANGGSNANTATAATAATAGASTGGNAKGNKGGKANGNTVAAAASSSAVVAAAASSSAVVSAAAASTSVAAAAASIAASANNNANNNNNNNNANNAAAATNTGSGADSTTLNADAIQSGSFFDGSDGLGAEATQALSTTSQNNFINFCSGKTLTNGLQIVDGSCNGIVMGDIPSKNNMISSVLLFPQNGQTLTAGKDFNISVQVNNLVAGSFTNADATYYAAPQTLQGGLVVGHTHVTVQDIGNSLNPQTPPDPTQFAFFKGINDAGNGKGLLQAVVTGGLPAGNYRVCTLMSASNHQPVIMPVAQRGAQDDCTKFTVSGNGGTTNVAANDGSVGLAAAAAVQSAVDLGPGALTTGAANAAAATKTGNAAAATQAAAAGNGGKKGGKGGKANGRLTRFSRRTFVA